MASTESNRDVLRIPHLASAKFKTWTTSFDEQGRRDQVTDDLFAAKTVSMLLVAIVTFGVIFGTIAVLLSL